MNSEVPVLSNHYYSLLVKSLMHPVFQRLIETILTQQRKEKAKEECRCLPDTRRLFMSWWVRGMQMLYGNASGFDMWYKHEISSLM